MRIFQILYCTPLINYSTIRNLQKIHNYKINNNITYNLNLKDRVLKKIYYTSAYSNMYKSIKVKK